MEYTDYDTRLAAYGVAVREGRVLLAMQRFPEAGTWALPGGGVGVCCQGVTMMV